MAFGAAALVAASAFAVPAGGDAEAAAVVLFDANGGELDDDIRIVKVGGTYGENANL